MQVGPSTPRPCYHLLVLSCVAFFCLQWLATLNASYSSEHPVFCWLESARCWLCCFICIVHSNVYSGLSCLLNATLIRLFQTSFCPNGYQLLSLTSIRASACGIVCIWFLQSRYSSWVVTQLLAICDFAYSSEPPVFFRLHTLYGYLLSQGPVIFFLFSDPYPLSTCRIKLHILLLLPHLVYRLGVLFDLSTVCFRRLSLQPYFLGFFIIYFCYPLVQILMENFDQTHDMVTWHVHEDDAEVSNTLNVNQKV